MVARPEDLVENLGSIDTATKLKAVRAVKNQIIGNKNKKLSYIKLGAVPRVVEILAFDTEIQLLVQSAATVGSFAYGVDDGVSAVLASDGVTHLIKTLSNLDENVVEAGVRALKMIYNSPMAPRANVFSLAALQRLVQLLSSSNKGVAEVAARVLARCCESKEQQEAIAAAGVLPGVLQLLALEEPSRQQAAADALAALTRGNPGITSQVLLYNAQGGKQVVTDQLLRLLRDAAPKTRYLASVCLTNLSGAMGEAEKPAAMAIQRAALPVLVRLLEEASVKEDVPGVLSTLIEGSEELQSAASDADAVSKLAVFLQDDSCSPKLKEGTLRALGALCMPKDREECREQLGKAAVLGIIIRSLEDPLPAIRIAACTCIRSLSRSAKGLRSNLMEENLAPALFRLVDDAVPDVQATASATLCNMVMDFSPIKDQMIQAGCAAQLVRLSGSMDPVLRLNAVWALQNLAFLAPPSVSASLMAALPWGSLSALLSDSEPEVQEKSVMLLRNLCHNKAAEIEKVIVWSNFELLKVLQERITPGCGYGLRVRHHAMYAICNIACSDDAQRDLVMSTGIPQLLVEALKDSSETIRVPTLWVIINLSWREGGFRGAEKRVGTLRELGVQAQVQALLQDESLDVRERAKAALDNFRWPGGGR